MTNLLQKLLGRKDQNYHKDNPDLLFGHLSSREEDKVWKEVTERATQDQERIMQQARKKTPRN